jgi:hypothetical protein
MDGNTIMNEVRVSLPADPELLALLDGGLNILNARGPFHPNRNALVSAALGFLAQRTAEDAIPAIRRFPPNLSGEKIDFFLTPQEELLVSELFHRLSLSMPRGTPVIDWDPPHVLTAALVLYSDHVLAGPHLRLV